MIPVGKWRPPPQSCVLLKGRQPIKILNPMELVPRWLASKDQPYLVIVVSRGEKEKHSMCIVYLISYLINGYISDTTFSPIEYTSFLHHLPFLTILLMVAKWKGDHIPWNSNWDHMQWIRSQTGTPKLSKLTAALLKSNTMNTHTMHDFVQVHKELSLIPFFSSMNNRNVVSF